MIRPGFPEPDEDFFGDTEEDIHGPIHSEENLRDCPEGFIYECCQGPGDKDPCVVDWHREKEYGAPKRRRFNV